ncbi:MAG: ABC transporter ATP-binding protein, partial [Alphaproteobacteria bacterium]
MRAAGYGRASRRAAEAVLIATALEKRFGAVRALAGLDLKINSGEFFALLGGSGSGKSTLLRVLAGFEAPDAGALTLDGQDLLAVPPWARPINMMFQSYALFPHMNVTDNIAYGLKRAGVAGEERRSRIAAALDLVGLQGLEARKPQQLSGGQKQRVALARSLVMRPRLLLLDEPMAALDAGLRERTGLELRALQRKTGAAFIMVTHDQQEALAVSDLVCVMRAGRIAQMGTPRELYDEPADAFIADFMGEANVLEGEVLGPDRISLAGISLASNFRAYPAGPALLAVRPEAVT